MGSEQRCTEISDLAGIIRELQSLTRRAGPTHPGVFEKAAAVHEAMERAGQPVTIDQFLVSLDKAILRLDDSEQQVVLRAAFHRRPYNHPLLVDRLNMAAEDLAKSRSAARSSSIQEVQLPAPSYKTVDRYRRAGIAKLAPLLVEQIQQHLPVPSQDHDSPVGPATYPLPGDYSDFVRDVTVPDGSLVQPGETIHKQWELNNGGNVPWIGRRLVRLGANGGYASPSSPGSIPIPDTAPGENVTISVNFVAPEMPANYIVHWKMADEHGRWCFPDRYRFGVWVSFVVPGAH
jgi:hypothetical protein